LETTNANVNVAGPTGAMNEGPTTDTDDNDTDGPAVCDHANDNAPPEPGELPDPSKVTNPPEATD